MVKRREAGVSAEERQLHLILRNLSPKIPDVNDYGTVLGYCVFNSLTDFRFVSRSEEERMLEEVKRVYEGFEKFSEALKKDDLYLPSLCQLQIITETTLDAIESAPILLDEELKKVTFDRSRIFYGILETLYSRGGNPLERLRRSGTDLDRIVKERGVIAGNRCCLLKDYRDIYSCFVRAKGDRRE